MRRAVTLTNSGPSTRDRRLRLAPVNRNCQRAWLVIAVIGATAFALAACGGGSGANLGTAALAANSAAAKDNGAAGTAGTAGGSASTPGAVPTVAAGAATGSGTTVVVGGTVTPGTTTTFAGGSVAPGTTATYTGGPITAVNRIGSASGFPTAPTVPSPGSGNATGSPAVVPPAAQAVKCPLPGPLSQAIPAGFDPVAAVRCVLTSVQPIEYRLEAAVSNLGPLLTALLAPSSTVSSFTAVPPCLVPMVNFSQLALVGANGQVIEPAIPVSVCGRPSEAVVASLAALTWTTVN
jgi:hypothetical protein